MKILFVRRPDKNHQLLILFAAVLVAQVVTATGWVIPPPATTTRTATTTTTTTRLGAVAKRKTDAELLPIVRDGIAEQGTTQEWKDCVKLLVRDLTAAQSEVPQPVVEEEEAAEVLLASALEWRGWARVTSALARKYMTPQRPDPDQLRVALDWLRTGPLALTDPMQRRRAIETSPKAYLVDPEAAYHQALATAPLPYRKDPDAFVALLLQDASVLERSYNCRDGGGCASECGNCWVSYEIKNGTPRGVDF